MTPPCWGASRPVTFNDLARRRGGVDRERHLRRPPAPGWRACPDRRVEGDFTLVHGSPRDPLWEYLISVPGARLALGAFDSTYCLVGHTHLPLVFRDEQGQVRPVAAPDGSRLRLDDRRLILNPGGVGQPRDGDPRACGMLLDTDTGTAEWRRVAYPLAEAQAAIRSRGLPPASPTAWPWVGDLGLVGPGRCRGEATAVAALGPAQGPRKRPCPALCSRLRRRARLTCWGPGARRPDEDTEAPRPSPPAQSGPRLAEPDRPPTDDRPPRATARGPAARSAARVPRAERPEARRPPRPRRSATEPVLPLHAVGRPRGPPEGARGAGARGRIAAALRRVLFGRPLASAEEIGERLSKKKALAIFSSDAISSSAYATEEILRVLVVAGAAALVFSLEVAIAIAILLAVVSTSYRQIGYAYPNGGGAYAVAKENLGRFPSLVAGGALLVDYVLTVAVSTSSAVAQITSALPELLAWTVPLGVFFIVVMTLGNLRGIRESGNIFAAPTYLFVASALLMIGWAPSASSSRAPAPSPTRSPAHPTHSRRSRSCWCCAPSRAGRWPSRVSRPSPTACPRSSRPSRATQPRR